MATQGDTEDYLTLVSITKSVSVFPKLLNPPKLVTLSNLDRQCPVHMYLVFFYPKNNNEFNLALDDDRNSVFGTLKSGLEETLSVWYPAAGRLSWLNPSDTADGNNKLHLWCNNEGCVVVEAETEVEVSELGDLSQHNEFFEKLVYKPVFNGDFSQMPLVVAQVTKFGCGGYSLGIGISHSLFDGPAAYDFMCAWASNSAAMTMKQRNNNVLEIINLNNNNKLPVHDRGTLILLQNREVEGCRAAAVDHLYQLIMQAAAVSSSSDAINRLNNECLINNQIDINNKYVHKTFHLSGALIESLKREVFCGDRCSSFEVVAAHLWKAKTKALGLRKETMVCLQFAVDARSKMEPPLPEGFSGNAYVLASVALTAAQVEEATHKDIIVKIRESKKSVTNNYVKAYMDAVGGPQTSLPPLKELTLISDWTRMPFHKIGFLQQAPAAYVSPLASPIPEVTYFMQNPEDSKGIDMRLGLLPQFLDAFALCFLTNK